MKRFPFAIFAGAALVGMANPGWTEVTAFSKQGKVRSVVQMIAQAMEHSGAALPINIEDFKKVIATNTKVTTTMRLLRADLDGDGTVARAEIDVVDKMSGFVGEPYSALGADKNGDGTISAAEISSAAQRMADAQLTGGILQALIDLDANSDGLVSETELQYALRHAAVSVPEQEHALECNLPSPTKAGEVVLVSGYEGNALSSVTVAGQDRETSLATLRIEPGQGPIYLIVSSLSPVIWEVVGATERIERMIVERSKVKDGPGAGIIGVPRARITFLQADQCLGYLESQSSGKALLKKGKISDILKKETRMIVEYEIKTLKIPSGLSAERIQPRHPTGTRVKKNGRLYELTDDGLKFLQEDPPQRPGSLSVDMLRFWPGGLAFVNVDEVVAPAAVENYVILPQEAGILQLIDQGKIRHLDDGAYLIQKPIPRFPAGLNGAHQVRFILGRDVPMPAGSPGHSSVYSEETGKCLKQC